MDGTIKVDAIYMKQTNTSEWINIFWSKMPGVCEKNTNILNFYMNIEL